MFLVVVDTPEGRETIPVTSRIEADWRADYERKLATYRWGNEDREDIGARVMLAGR